jgi:hypothetical protein
VVGNLLGALLGGFVIKWTGSVELVYAVIGGSCIVIALLFYLFSPLGHAEDYLPGGVLEAPAPIEPLPAPVEGPGEATIGR